MTPDDFRAIDSGSTIEADICLVGSGPAGWAIAEELRDSGLRILILESGGLEPDPDADALNRIECIGAELQNGRNRVLGGTSYSWNGRCASLEDIDYEERPWIPFSGWPFGSETIAPYLDRAYEYLGAGPDRPAGRGSDPAGLLKRPDVNPALLRTVCWQYSKDAANPNSSMRFGPRLLARQRTDLRILVHATVTHLNTDPSGSYMESVEVADPQGRRATIQARAVVLCAGGVDNARILLYSNRILPNGVGNLYDVVGRFLMDHPRDPDMIVRFDTRDAAPVHALFGSYKLDSARGRHLFYDGLALSVEQQRREDLLNCAAWLNETWAADDPIEAAKRLALGPRNHAVRDAGLVISQPGIMLRALGDSLLKGRSVTHKMDSIGFLAWSEQRPDPESRIRLSGHRDRLELPISEIDWRISAQERASHAALGQAIVREFKRLGLPSARPADWIRDGRHEDAKFESSNHPSGTTRMASNPRHGVVDANCQVHGVEGLYVAGSSVFPTSGGHANPTLMIVALAVRLARQLKECLSTKARSRPVRSRSAAGDTALVGGE